MKGNHARMNQRYYQSSFRRKRTYSRSMRHYEDTQDALKEDVNADYKIKETFPINDQQRLQLKIDEKIERWNKTVSDGKSYDFHGMSAKGAATYAIKIMKRVLDKNKDEETSGNFQRDLEFITGAGKHSKNKISAIKKVLFKELKKEFKPWQYIAKNHWDNPGIVMIYFD